MRVVYPNMKYWVDTTEHSLFFEMSNTRYSSNEALHVFINDEAAKGENDE